MEINQSKMLEIGATMNAQNNRSTQWPLFVIQVDEKRYVSEYDEYENRERKEEFEISDLCAKCKILCENDDSLPEDCDDCGGGSFHHFVMVEEFDLRAGVFFTAEACEHHIATNRYHYRNPRSFGISAWRNPEMQTVMQYLSENADPFHVPAPFYR